MDIVNEIKASFKQGSYLTQLIYVNLAVFVFVNLLTVFFFLAGESIYSSPIISYLAVPADIYELLWKPWTVITYMFLHEAFLHILFNMLWLYWFGKIFLQYLDQKQLLSVYLMGGFAGAFLFIVSYNIFPVLQSHHAVALGASASVMAVVFAISFYVPNYQLPLMFIGNVRLKYIAIFSIIIDVISIPTSNSGGHIAHIGGAVFGWYFITEYKKGKLITKGFDTFLEKVFTFFQKNSKPKMSYKKTGNTDYDYKNKKATEQNKMNVILEKISKSGYSSLTKEEKELLFKMGQK